MGEVGRCYNDFNPIKNNILKRLTFNKCIKLFWFIFILQINLIYSQTWVQLADFPGTERDDGCVFTINNKAYCFSGLDVNFQCQANGFVFDGNSESWSYSMASLPAGKERQYATAFSYSNTGYVLGGINCSNVCLNDFWQYNTTTNSWSALPNFPAIGRQGMCNIVLNNKVYVIGGKNTAGNVLNEVWEYNFTTTTWTQKNNLPFAGTWRGAAFEINGKGYTCYGLKNDDSYNRTIYEYNATTDTWQSIPNINLPARRYIGCAITSNKAFLYGGADSLNQITNDIHLFNPITNTITTHSGIPTVGRRGGMSFSLNNKFYITTGVDTSPARIKETWKNDQFVGLNEFEKNNFEITIFPNPASEEVYIQSSKKILKLTITSILGELMVDTNIQPIAVSELPNGMYSLTVTFEGNSITKKLILKH